MTQSDIINNNFSKAFECIKCSNAYDTGEVLSEEKLFKQISERKHSTFDLSKFEVVGSPTITDDGIASGFKSRNILASYNIKKSKNFEVRSHFILNSVGKNVNCITGSADSGLDFKVPSLQITAGKVIEILIPNSQGNAWQKKRSTYVFEANIPYWVNYGVDNNNIAYVEYSTDSRNFYRIIEFELSEDMFISTYKVGIGNSLYTTTNTNQFFDGKIDLSHFSITVDGKEVFSGNKTGIDTIKADNYEVVGSPVISDDGVASGFSSGNYIKKDITLQANNSIEYEFVVKLPHTTYATNRAIFNPISTSNDFLAFIYANYGYVTFNGFGGSSQEIKLGGTYKIRMSTYSNGTFALNWTDISTGVQGSKTGTNACYSTVNNTLLTITLGLTLNNKPQFPFVGEGSIDLNAFKIYVDGNLVYQPCLKIPYTQSKTGSKIVPAYARDKVLDVYEQYGNEYNYYTIDEENKNFTLPIGNDYDNSARPSLENLGERGHEKLATSLMYETGNVSNDEKGYKQLTKMNRSSFDLSKFTVVGSPTITDDGVASGFSRANYLQKLSILPTEAGHNYIFKTRYKHITNNFSVTGYMFNIITTTGNYFGAMARTQTKTISFVNTIKGTSIISDFNALIEGETYDIEYHTDFSTYVKYYIDGDLKQSLTYNATGYPTTGNVLIGVSSNAEMPLTMGSVDLKQFSITVDGKEVFNGNKTGIDTIKPDNYTVVGSPVISEDGVAIFDTSSALSTGVLGLDGTKDWDIYFDFNNTGATTIPISTVGANKYHLQIGCGRNNGVFLQIGNADGGAWGYNSQWIANVLSAGLNKVHYKYKASETKYFIYINDMLKFSIVNSNTVNDNYNMLIGNATSLNSPVTQGFDLNSLKIYQEGNLIYQPCLKIPYTQSKTGSKIVDVTYRDRVIDLYEQESKAGYYTIDEPNKNFTLPMGEIYGMIEDTRDSIPTKISQLTNDSGFINSDSTFVHKTGNETVAGVKTFTGNPVFSNDAFGGQLSVNRTNNSNGHSAVKFLNGGTVKGYLGIDSNSNPIYTNPSTTTYNLVRNSAANTAVGSATKPVYINSSGVATAITSYGGNSATATKATQDSSGNQINTSYMPLKYSKYSIATYASSNPYIKLATFTINNTHNYDNSILFWVEILPASANRAYALCKLSARWGGTSYAGTNFEILEKYGDSSLFKLFDTLIWAYKYTTASSKGSIVGEIWMSTHTASYTTYYLRPTECNEYGDYGQTTVTMASNPWTYYNKSGNSTAIASTAITSGYTQAKITDKSTAKLLNSKVDTSSLVECQVVINTYVNGTSGYRIWSDGYCEQWGRGALNEVATTTITLLKAYKDTNYSVSAVSITASTAQDTEAGLQCTPKSATQITLTAHYINPNNQTACWQTKGYLAEGEY